MLLTETSDDNNLRSTLKHAQTRCMKLLNSPRKNTRTNKKNIASGDLKCKMRRTEQCGPQFHRLASKHGFTVTNRRYKTETRRTSESVGSVGFCEQETNSNTLEQKIETDFVACKISQKNSQPEW